MTPDRSTLDFCYLTTTGRVTGMPHRIEIWFAVYESTVYLMAGDRDRSDWVRNLMADPEVTLELGDRKRASRARVVEAGTDEDALARRLLLEKYGDRPGSRRPDRVGPVRAARRHRVAGGHQLHIARVKCGRAATRTGLVSLRRSRWRTAAPGRAWSRPGS